MVPKNIKSFTIGYALAVNAQQADNEESTHPSIVILGGAYPCVVSGADSLRELKTAIDFALSNSNTQE